MKKNDIGAIHKEFDVLMVAIPDMTGRLVGRRRILTNSNADSHFEVELCSSILAWDVEQLPIDDLSVAGFHTGWHDLKIIPDLSTVRTAAWLHRTAVVIGDLYDKDSKLSTVAPRYILQQQLKKLKEAGLTAYVATELEFYLAPEVGSEYPQDKRRHDYAIDDYTDQMESFFKDLRGALAGAKIPIESWQAEWGQGQWEVNISYGDPLETADSHTLLKLAIKNLARSHKLKANFMAKPSSELVGSSGHIHISLYDKSGTNVLYDTTATDKLSQAGRHAIQGILKYTHDCLALYAGNVNSYRRLASGEFCGHGPSWGFDNRTVTCRVLGSDNATFRLEFRIPGADANPYLSLAGVIASIRKGMINQETPPDVITGDAANEDINPYPLNLESATKAFKESAFAKEEFGTDFVAHYSRHLCHEAEQFSTAVTDWEIERYA